MKEIPLSRGMTAIIDDEDLDRVSQFKWSLTCHKERKPPDYYARRSVYRAGKAAYFVGTKKRSDVIGLAPITSLLFS
jgi:hypothetical protein